MESHFYQIHSWPINLKFFRFSFRAMLVGSILIHIISLLAIKRQKYLITPQILHSGDATQKSRHNRAMVTLKAVGAFLLFYFFVAGMLFVFSRAKRKPFHFYYRTHTIKIIARVCSKFLFHLNSGTNFGTITVVVLPWTPSHLPDSILPPYKPRYKELCKEDNRQLETIKKAIEK